MIIGKDISVIGFQVEFIKKIITPHGVFNLMIEQDLVLGNGVLVDLYSVIHFLKSSLSEGIARLDLGGIPELGSTPLNEIDLSEETPDSLIYLDFGELSNRGCVFHLGYNGDEERLIYSLDGEKTYQEKNYPRGTIQNLIEAIPNWDELEIIQRGEMIALTDIKNKL